MDCKHCGRDIADTTKRMSADVGDRCLRHGECWRCNFWMEIARNMDQFTVVDAGEVYRIALHPVAGYRGFGGRRWVVKFKDGKQLHTDNLWSNGRVPEHLREYLPDNATVMAEAHWIKENTA